MDREKYVWNSDYREGYDDGVKAGREQIQIKVEQFIIKIKKLLDVIHDESEG